MVTDGLSSSAVLAAFAEPLVEGRRVLVFGSALSQTPRLLLERGARLVHVCDPVPLRVAEAARRTTISGLTSSTLGDDELVAREGAVDCVLVEHLGAFDARAIVQKARRLLAVRGVALFATPNREAHRPLLPPPEPQAAPLDYYALYDLVAGEFEYVHMLGQAPFVGYAVVSFAPDAELEPTIDADFVARGSEEPELFVAVAARHRPSLAGHALVQLPLGSVLGSLSSGTAERTPVRPAARPVEKAPPELVKKLEQQEAWIAELEARAATADERADVAEDELETLRERAELERGAEARRGELSKTLDEARARARAAEEMRDALALRLTNLEGELERQKAMLAAQAAEAGVELAPDIDALEQKLGERGGEIRRLERDLAEAERIGRELLGELELARSQPARAPAPAPTAELDALAARLATAEADRLALSWLVSMRSEVAGDG